MYSIHKLNTFHFFAEKTPVNATLVPDAPRPEVQLMYSIENIEKIKVSVPANLYSRIPSRSRVRANHRLIEIVGI